MLEFRNLSQLTQNGYTIDGGVCRLSMSILFTPLDICQDRNYLDGIERDCYANGATYFIDIQRLIRMPVLMTCKQQSISSSSLLAVPKESIVTSQPYLPFACIGDSSPAWEPDTLFLKR